MSDGLALAMKSLIRQLPGARRVDGWINVVTGLGSGLVDKVKQTLPTPFRGGLPDSVLSDMFLGDSTVRNAICCLPDDALRLGFTVSVPKDAGGHEVSTKIQDAADDLDLVQQYRRACYWERLFGGAVLFTAVDDGQYALDSQERPINMASLRKLMWIKAIDRCRIRPSYDPGDVDQDETSPTYGEPLIFTLDLRMTGASVRVHRSRLIIFPGAVTTDYELRARQGWGISILDFVYDALQRNAAAWASAAAAVSNAQYVVYKLRGLAHLFSAQDGEAKAKQRANSMEMAKSMINAVLIDAEDDYIRENPNFGNFGDMLDRFMLDVCAALNIPATRLWGRSPAGMNATGQSDIENWTGTCDAYREHHLRPRLHELLNLLLSSKEGPTRGVLPEGWRVTFPPLRQLSALEQADVRLKTSQADASDITAGILLPQEVAVSRFRPEGYSQQTTIDIDTRERLLKIEIDQREVELKAGRGPGQTPPEPDPVLPGQTAKPAPAPAKKAAA